MIFEEVKSSQMVILIII